MHKILYRIRNTYSFLPQIIDIFSPFWKIHNWKDYFCDFFGLIKKEYIIYSLKSGLKIKARTHTLDKFIIVETNLHNVYTPKDFKVGQEDTVLDIGAQIGSFSLLAAKSARFGKVFSLEPELSNFKLLRENIVLNSFSNVVAKQIALGKNSGTGLIYLNQKNTGGHSIVLKDGSDKSEKIEIISLLDFIRNNSIHSINFLKMDIEGAEYDVLFSLPQEVFALIDKIILEYHQIDKEKNGKVLKMFLERSGFKVKTKQLPFATTGMLYAKSLN